MKRLHCELEAKGVTDASANFICALALAAPEGSTRVVEGKVFGTLTWPPRGLLGFGYDPIFVPNGYTQTFGEMARAAKNALSHRMRAFENLMAATYDDD
jgi:XTP/dITP diphosphohydrolase